MLDRSSRLLSPAVAAAVSARWPDVGPAWCAAAESEFWELCERYRARPVQVFRSRYGLVVEVVADGQPLVFRGSADPASVHQHQIALALAKLGVGPAIEAYVETVTGSLTISERIFPGTALGDMDPAGIDFQAVCAALRPLAGRPAPKFDLPTLSDWLRGRLVDDTLTDLAPGQSPASITERQDALAVLDELERSGNSGLCHGDASPWNLLFGTADQVKLVDPRGLSGEVGFDLAVTALKAGSLLPVEVSIPYLAREVGIDPDRIRAWADVAQAARV